MHCADEAVKHAEGEVAKQADALRRQADDEWRELKDAWRSGTLWSDGDMRRKLVITVGGTMTIFGMFSLLMVLFRPSSVKLLLAATMVYAIVRLTDALLRG